ncbi:MAG: hypothetical protein JJE18_10950 [Eubacteriaceae bacterium]|nr:hypothetical protein [Eubacteriaceae bacterium]
MHDEKIVSQVVEHHKKNKKNRSGEVGHHLPCVLEYAGGGVGKIIL